METSTRTLLSNPPISDLSPTTTTTTNTTKQDVPLYHDIAFGSIAGTIGKIVEYPFDTVKVRLQSQPDHLPLRYTGPLDCFRQSIHTDGFRGLYRGVSVPLAGAAAETACLFTSYEIAKDFLANNVVKPREGRAMPLSSLITAGGMSGAFTATILTPIELIKCRMQVPLHSPLDPTLRPGVATMGLTSASLSPLAVLRDVFRREGLRGFWRGHTGTFLRETGGTAAWFGGNEGMLSYLRTRIAAKQSNPTVNVSEIEVPIPGQLLSGAVAGMSYNFLFYPADTIKSKIQTGELSHGGVRPTFLGVGRELWRVHGLKGLYRGCGITVARSAPSSALIFTVVAQLKEAFKPA